MSTRADKGFVRRPSGSCEFCPKLDIRKQSANTNKRTSLETTLKCKNSSTASRSESSRLLFGSFVPNFPPCVYIVRRGVICHLSNMFLRLFGVYVESSLWARLWVETFRVQKYHQPLRYWRAISKLKTPILSGKDARIYTKIQKNKFKNNPNKIEVQDHRVTQE